MNNPTARNASSLAQNNEQGTGEIGQKLKVTLIVEHSANRWDGSIILELAGLLSPANVEISLIHATPDLLEGLPKRRDRSGMIEQHVQERTIHQEEDKASLRRAIQVAGFGVEGEQSFQMESDSLQPILDFLRETGQELMVLCGNHSPGAIMGRNHFFLNLTSHASISTLMLKRKLNHKGAMLQTLFGADASEASLNAARKLGRLLPAERISLTLATVQSPVYQENAILAPYVNQEILTEALETNAGMVFEMFTDILTPQGFKVNDFKVLIGSPATELGYLAETENPDLVVVGSHNHKGFLAWVMGSVSSQLLHWDTHNILVIR